METAGLRSFRQILWRLVTSEAGRRIRIWCHAAKTATRHIEMDRMQNEVEARAADYSTFFKKIVGARSDPVESQVGSTLTGLAGEVNRSLRDRSVEISLSPPSSEASPTRERSLHGLQDEESLAFSPSPEHTG